MPNNPLKSLTVAIIASNEECNLERCLTSLNGIASEIILIHNDCIDRTVHIAKKYGTICIEKKWHGHRDQKNIALNHSTMDWVLCLDADESLSAKLRIEITKFLLKPTLGITAVKFNRKSRFMGRWINHGDWYPDTKIRLVKSGCAKWAGSSEHDKIEVLKGGISKVKGDLLHYSYPKITTFVEKTIYFSDIYLKFQLDSGNKWNMINPLIRPPWRFIRCYVLRLGFLDGFPGLFIALSIAYMTLVKHCRLYENGPRSS